MSSNILPILELDELCAIFEYPNARQARRAMKAGTFPIPVFTMANRTVAHVDAVKAYFEERRAESMTWLQKRYGIDPDQIKVTTEPRLDYYRRIGRYQLSEDNP